jgi:hypothetical protein
LSVLFVASLLFGVLFAWEALWFRMQDFNPDRAFILFVLFDAAWSGLCHLSLVLLLAAAVGTSVINAVLANRAARDWRFLLRGMLVLTALAPLIVPAWVPYHILTMDPLHKAARAGNLRKVEAMLAAGTDPNLRDEWGAVPLGYAVEGRHADVAEALLRRGADPNLRFPLVLAAYNGDLPTMKALLAHGANPNQGGPDMMPLEAAARSGNPEAVKLLLENGARPFLFGLHSVGQAGPPTQFDPVLHTFVDSSDGTAAAKVLTKAQAINLMLLLPISPSKSPPSSALGSKQSDSRRQPCPAPSLCIDVYRDRTRTELLGQILGFDRNFVVVDRLVIDDRKAVDAIYKAVGR